MAIEQWSTPHSTNIGGIEYDNDTQTMTITFKSSGATYSWSGISRQQASALAGDSSPGRYLKQNFPVGRKA